MFLIIALVVFYCMLDVMKSSPFCNLELILDLKNVESMAFFGH